MKINQMKKDEYFEGFYLERITLPLHSRMILERFQATYGMLSLIMSKNLPQVK